MIVMIIAVFHRKLIWPPVRALSKLKRHLLDLTLWTTVLRATTTIDRWRHICFHLRFQSKFTCFYTLERCEQCKKQVVQLQTQNNMQKFTVIKRLTGAKNVNKGLVVLNIWIGTFSFIVDWDPVNVLFVTCHPFMLMVWIDTSWHTQDQFQRATIAQTAESHIVEPKPPKQQKFNTLGPFI